MTKDKAEKNTLRTANLGFSALLLVLFGWINLEVLLLSRSAGVHGHLLGLAIGASLSAVAYRRYKTWWAPFAHSTEDPASRASFRPRWTTRFLLVGAGFLMACAMRLDLLGSAVIGAGIFTLIPWARSSFCRQNFFASHALLVAGGLPVLLIDAKYQHSLVLLGTTWLIWTLAAGLLLSTMLPRKLDVSSPNQVRTEPKICEGNIQ